MAKETKILKLYQVTRPEDDDKAFNIQTMLNDNWDKIDKAFEKASTAEAEEGTNTEKIMTPKTTKDAILKLAPTPPVVTTSSNGLMSSADKTKLNNLPPSITVTTAQPSGGVNGDIWLVV